MWDLRSITYSRRELKSLRNEIHMAAFMAMVLLFCRHRFHQKPRRTLLFCCKQERNFTDLAVPEDIQYQLRIDPETCIAADISNSLWWFEDESPADCLGEYTNYTFHAYDLDNGIYYYIEFDS